MNNQIDYKDIIDLGFDVLRSEDEVFFNQYGYDYKIFTYNLSEGFTLDWCQVERVCKLQRGNSEGAVFYEKILNGLDEVKEFIKMFKGTNKDPNKYTYG